MDCEQCGACCAHAGAGAVEFSEGLPADNRADTECVAFRGNVGGSCGCGIYERRPEACRVFQAGSEECIDSRRLFGL